jgi:hypothetical protein
VSRQLVEKLPIMPTDQTPSFQCSLTAEEGANQLARDLVLQKTATSPPTLKATGMV